MIINKIKNRIKPGEMIPKPKTKNQKIVGWFRNKKGELCLQYKIKNKSIKNIPDYCLESAYEQLQTGLLTKKWLVEKFPNIASQGCSFTTIGGIFKYLKYAEYDKPGKYILVKK